MTIRHHIDDETLLAYAAGDLDEAFSLMVAAHISLCPECRRTVQLGEDIGGALVETLAPAEMSSDAVSRAMTALDVRSPSDKRSTPAPYNGRPVLPAPLRERFGGDVDDVAWRRIGPGVHQARVHDIDGNSSARLLRIAAGMSVPEHGHVGEEMTMVLAGGFKDGDRSYVRGDVDCANADIVHRPVADDGEACICLAVTSAPLKFFNLFGRIAQPFARI